MTALTGEVRDSPTKDDCHRPGLNAKKTGG